MMAIDRGVQYDSLIDELVKIAQDPSQQNSKNRAKEIAKAVIATGIGAGLGHMTGDYLLHRFGHLMMPTPSRIKAVKIILPILGAAAGILQDRYRREIDKRIFGNDGK